MLALDSFHAKSWVWSEFEPEPEQTKYPIPGPSLSLYFDRAMLRLKYKRTDAVTQLPLHALLMHLRTLMQPAD